MVIAVSETRDRPRIRDAFIGSRPDPETGAPDRVHLDQPAHPTESPMSTFACSSQPRALELWLALTLAPVAAGGAQAPVASPPFTIDDALDVVSYNVPDISDDGEWIVATSASRRDLLGV